MIVDLLDTVKAESGTLQMKWELTKPAELLAEWVESHRILGKKKGIALETCLSGFEHLKIPMDVPKLQRVIDNLLTNAVKFTSQGTIRVTLTTDDARAYISVEDSGSGVPAEEREKIFDRYYQSTRTSLKDHGGSGIGLSFALEMTEAHHGRIWVEESDLSGAKFTLALPLTQEVEITGEYHLEEHPADAARKGSMDVAYPPERPRSVDPRKPTILVAEDNPGVAQVVAASIGTEFNVHFAADGVQAWKRLEHETFDCLLTDIVMPRMRGDELEAPPAARVAHMWTRGPEFAHSMSQRPMYRLAA